MLDRQPFPGFVVMVSVVSQELQRRLGARVREASADGRERAREQDELAALRRAVWGGRAPGDPAAAAAFARAAEELQALYRPRLLVDTSLQVRYMRLR